MCGFAGLFKRSGTSCDPHVIDRMRDEASSRGPDDAASEWFAPQHEQWQRIGDPSQWQAAMGFRRLSILDLSLAGHQPMCYRERFWLTFNGEIYNFVELRAELEKLGHTFRSNSDSEVILAAYVEWGSACFQRLRGMWAITIIDLSKSIAWFCRDRLGIKPFYIWRGDGLIATASELKQFKHVPGFVPNLNHESALEYISSGYEDCRRTFFRDIQPLPGGTFARLDLNTLTLSEPVSFWNPESLTTTIHDPIEAAERFKSKFIESVNIHLRSDVPVATALSGGLDSSSIASVVNLLKGTAGDPLHTFTITFPGDATDETEFVRAVCDTIRSEPHFIEPRPEEFASELRKFVYAHDEPVGSTSIYAGYVIARLINATNIKVTLNGQGGDEILGGYWQSYFLYLFQSVKSNPLRVARHFAGSLFAAGNPGLVSNIPFMWRRYNARKSATSPVRLKRGNQSGPSTIFQEVMTLDRQQQRIYEIRQLQLPRLLKWEDRNAMASSVEGRYPFLDHELMELCLQFDPEVIYHNGWTKVPLRTGMKGILTPKVLNRKSKFGFETPQNKWLSGPLRTHIEQWVRSDSPVWDYVERSDVASIASTFFDRAGDKELGELLFRLFMLHLWFEEFQVKP